MYIDFIIRLQVFNKWCGLGFENNPKTHYSVSDSENK